jgi:hypothetical protein
MSEYPPPDASGGKSEYALTSRKSSVPDITDLIAAFRRTVELCPEQVRSRSRRGRKPATAIDNVT